MSAQVVEHLPTDEALNSIPRIEKKKRKNHLHFRTTP
jgi:hypothetical protein